MRRCAIQKRPGRGRRSEPVREVFSLFRFGWRGRLREFPPTPTLQREAAFDSSSSIPGVLRCAGIRSMMRFRSKNPECGYRFVGGKATNWFQAFIACVSALTGAERRLRACMPSMSPLQQSRKTLRGLCGAGLAMLTVLAQTPREIGSRLELFVTGDGIDKLDHAELRVHPPTPAEIAVTCDAPWEGPVTGFAAVLKDGDLYRLYYPNDRGETQEPSAV